MVCSTRLWAVQLAPNLLGGNEGRFAGTVADDNFVRRFLGEILAKILAAGWIGELARDDVGSGGPCPRL